MDAAQHWATQLADWAIPEHVRRGAEASPWRLDVAPFRADARRAGGDTPSRRAALAALPHGGSVLDVGCGAGAASVALAERAPALTGVDSDPAMLAAFTQEADRRGLAARTVQGSWPAVATSIPEADVVVCHHVAYNVAGLEPFALALTAHARQRVVVELTAVHPLAWTAPLWRALHGLDRPKGPTVDDALAVLAGAGIAASIARWQRPFHTATEDPEALMAGTARRLCLPTSRADELAAAWRDHPPPRHRDVATLWWDAPVAITGT